MSIVLALVIGVIAGVSGGLFGIGGGIIIVPALVVAFGFTQQKAQGTSLVALLAPVGLLALLEYHKRGDADLKLGALIALGFVVGSIFGAKIAVGLSPETMRRTFAVFLMCVSIWMFVRK
ncbi:MAG: sulfite exporter TauE/SafE family protein [Armatimonadetes bacterium]|nr:sulfite exporter TauE/SafE family protein [Armatimonadota bacterium]